MRSQILRLMLPAMVTNRPNRKAALGPEFWELERELLYNQLFPLILDAAHLGVTDGAALLASGSVDISVVNQAAANWAAKHSGELINGIVDSTRRDIGKGIAQWVDDNGTLPELIDWFDTSFRFSASKAEEIAVTEVTRAYAEGNLQSWKNSGVVKGKRWLTAFDDRVCVLCGPLHDKRVGLFDAFVNEEQGVQYSAPPAHPRCRCALFPVAVMPKGKNAPILVLNWPKPEEILLAVLKEQIND